MIIILKYFVIWIILTKVVLSNELDCLVNDKSINHEIDNDNDNDINNDIDKCIDYSDIENCGCSLPKDTLKTYLNNVDDIELIEDCSSKGDCCGKTPLDMIDIQTCHNIDKITHLASSDSIISNSRNIFNNNNISIEDMVLIPNGTFIMGTNNPLIVGDGEGPKRSVIISTSFLLDIYEVSNHKFKEFIDSTNYITESELFGWSFVFNTAVPNKIKNKISQAVLGAEWWLPVDKSYWKQPEGPDTDVFTTNRGDYPVVQVSWNDANQYCLWRGGRLPSEAEWEFAANGGKQGNKFPWGNKLTTKGKHRANIYQGKFPTNNTVEDGHEYLSPINEYGPQNDYGLYNMIGNAWEWVQDWHTIKHSTIPSTDPKGPITGTEKVKKGGSFLCHKSFCYRYRNIARYPSTPDSASLNIGFRCAKDI